MTPELLSLAVRILGALLLWFAHSVIVGGLQHPQDAEGRWASFLRLLGRLSFLRFDDAPGTLHRPGAAQPWPELAVDDLLRGQLVTAPSTKVIISSSPPPIGLYLLALLGATLIACLPPPGIVATERSLASSLQAQTKAVTDFAAYDAAHQLEIVKGSKSRSEAQGKLQAYRSDRVRVTELLKRSAEALDAAAASLAGPVPAGGGR